GLTADPLSCVLKVAGAPRGDGDFSAFTGESASDAVADAVARAADDRNPILQEQIHLKSQALQEHFRIFVEHMLQHFLGIAVSAPGPEEGLVGDKGITGADQDPVLQPPWDFVLEIL